MPPTRAHVLLTGAVLCMRAQFRASLGVIWRQEEATSVAVAAAAYSATQGWQTGMF